MEGDVLAKEWDKFQADYKKLKTTYKDVTKDEQSAAAQRFRLANANTSEGEANLRSAITKARRDGVTGNDFAAFVKNKDFKEAVQLLNVAAKELDEQIAGLDKLAATAGEAADKFATLHAAIEKDLKGRKDSSESKKDIIKLKETIEGDFQELKAIETNAPKPVLPIWRNYGSNFQKTVEKILKEDPDAAASQTDGNELPTKLVDRVLNSNLQKCRGAAKDIKALCDAAFDLAGNGDKAGALTNIKQAAERRKEVTPIVADYQKIARQYPQDIEISKDKKKIEAAIAEMVELDATTERTIRGLATTLQKAG